MKRYPYTQTRIYPHCWQADSIEVEFVEPRHIYSSTEPLKSCRCKSLHYNIAHQSVYLQLEHWALGMPPSAIAAVTVEKKGRIYRTTFNPFFPSLERSHRKQESDWARVLFATP